MKHPTNTRGEAGPASPEVARQKDGDKAGTGRLGEVPKATGHTSSGGENRSAFSQALFLSPQVQSRIVTDPISHFPLPSPFGNKVLATASLGLIVQQSHPQRQREDQDHAGHHRNVVSSVPDLTRNPIPLLYLNRVNLPSAQPAEPAPPHPSQTLLAVPHGMQGPSAAEEMEARRGRDEPTPLPSGWLTLELS